MSASDGVNVCALCAGVGAFLDAVCPLCDGDASWASEFVVAQSKDLKDDTEVEGDTGIESSGDEGENVTDHDSDHAQVTEDGELDVRTEADVESADEWLEQPAADGWDLMFRDEDSDHAQVNEDDEPDVHSEADMESADESLEQPAEDTANLGPYLGEIEVNFLDGQCVMVPVSRGQKLSRVKTEVFCRKPPPPGMLPQLLTPTGIVKGDEDVAEFLGVPLTALITRMPLCEQTRQLLSQCTSRAPEDGSINFIEMSWKIRSDEVDNVVELLVAVQPRRVILSDPEIGVVKKMAKKLKTNLQVEDVELFNVTVADVKDVWQILRRCPALRTCKLRNEGLTANHVKEMRSELNHVSIVI